MATPTYDKSELYHRADYNSVPEKFRDQVCRCSGAKSYCNPLKAVAGLYDLSQYTIPFEWWVCSKCLKPAPLNALNARLIRECEACENPYFVSVTPTEDKMNLCQWCLENN